MEKQPSVLETLDDLPLFTATEVSLATGIGRKSIGKRSKKYDLGEEKYLTEGFQRTPRTYFSVDDAIILSQLPEKVRPILRRNLIESTKNKFVKRLRERTDV